MTRSHEIDDNEYLYRKVSVKSGWYDPQRNELKPEALKPRQTDSTGISFDRAASSSHPEFRSMEQSAQGPSTNGYYVAVYQVGDLRSHGFTIAADPQPDNPGHALLEDLRYDNRKSHISQEKMVRLAHQLVLRVDGPFHVGG